MRFLALLVLMVLATLAFGSLIPSAQTKSSAKTCTVETVGTPDCPR